MVMTPNAPSKDKDQSTSDLNSSATIGVGMRNHPNHHEERSSSPVFGKHNNQNENMNIINKYPSVK